MFQSRLISTLLTNYSNGKADIVTIEAIDNNGKSKEFVVHKSFICHYSPFFDAAFNGRFAEGATQSMLYPTHSLEAFGSFIDWIYSLKIEDGNGSTPCIQELVYLYVIADHLLIPKLQNQVLEKINGVVGESKELPTAIFGYVYANTTDGHALRRLIVDLYIQYAGKIEVENEQEFPHEMLIDMFNAAFDKNSRKTAKFSKDKMKKYLISEEEILRY